MIYAIVSGCYSDTTYHGYFTEPEDAYRYCMILNNRGSYYESDYYVDPLPEIRLTDLDDYDSQKPIGFKYIINASKRNNENEWVFRIADISCVESAKHNFVEDVEKGWGWIRRYVTVYIKDYNPDKAIKIAQDVFYKKLAEEAGL